MIPVYNLVRPDESYMVVSLPSIQLTPNNGLRRWAGGLAVAALTDLCVFGCISGDFWSSSWIYLVSNHGPACWNRRRVFFADATVHKVCLQQVLRRSER